MYLYNRTYNRNFVDQSINFEFKIRPDYMEIQKAYRRKNPFSEKQNLNIVEKIGKKSFSVQVCHAYKFDPCLFKK